MRPLPSPHSFLWTIARRISLSDSVVEIVQPFESTNQRDEDILSSSHNVHSRIHAPLLEFTDTIMLEFASMPLNEALKSPRPNPRPLSLKLRIQRKGLAYHTHIPTCQSYQPQ